MTKRDIFVDNYRQCRCMSESNDLLTFAPLPRFMTHDRSKKFSREVDVLRRSRRLTG